MIFLKAFCPNIATQGVKASIYEFLEDTIQSIIDITNHQNNNGYQQVNGTIGLIGEKMGTQLG